MENLPFTDDAKKWLRTFWDESEREYWDMLLHDPVKFIQEVANPFLRDLQKKGKKVPIFQRSRDTNGQLLIITSWENSV